VKYNKLYIALKEANESLYWLELLHETNFLPEEEYNSISEDCDELIKLLVSITKTLKLNNKTTNNP
jgi:four helix bundle protein